VRTFTIQKNKKQRRGAERSSIKPNNMVFIQHHHTMKDSLPSLFDHITVTPSSRARSLVRTDAARETNRDSDDTPSPRMTESVYFAR